MGTYPDLLAAFCRFGGFALLVIGVLIGALGVVRYMRQHRAMRYSRRLISQLEFDTVITASWGVGLGSTGIMLMVASF